MSKSRVLFLCTHNSARSQMAEGLLRAMAGERFEVQSAGTEQTRVHPLAIRAMAERGVDISGHTSKLYVGLLGEPWDYVITVCDDANERLGAEGTRRFRTQLGGSVDAPPEGEPERG